MASWEDVFTSWAAGPGTTEQSRAENAEKAVRKAIAANEKLSQMDITVFPHGSYRNRTSVRQDSDVDICVRLNTTFFPDYPAGKTKEYFGNVTSNITYADFKNSVYEALIEHFGRDYVKRGDKAFDIHENTYRIDADVIATFEHRRYVLNSDGSYYYLSGIEFRTDSGKKIKNWPEQNYRNGCDKHAATGRRFKKIIRIIKRLRNVMDEEGIAAAKPIVSCLIESLVWNVPNEGFGHDTYTADVHYTLAHSLNNTRAGEDCSEWGEVNELKYLFRPSQPWSPQQAHDFVAAAWDFIGFE
jgi:hypothetical protein